MKISKKVIPLAISCALFFTAAEASFPGISKDMYIRGFILGGENVPVYLDSKLKVQGTAKPYKEYDSVLYPTTEVRIYEVRDNWAYIGYNSFWSGKREGYIPLSALTSKNFSKDGRRSSKRIDDVYKRPGERYPNSAVYAGDTVYTLAKSGEYVQIVYPAAEVYKLAWVKEKDCAWATEGEEHKAGNTVNISLKIKPLAYESLFKMSPGEELPDISQKDMELLIALAMKYSYHENVTITPQLIKSKGLMRVAELFPEGLQNLNFEYLSYNSPIRNSILNRIIISLAQNKPVVIGAKKGNVQSYALIVGYAGKSGGKFNAEDFRIYAPRDQKEARLSEWLAGFSEVTRIVY
ncbi:MAG: hypothetical protein J6O04_02055 [Selenomonadaceae bacterium]|nr:hypothetical protein [Selenomonadaceae bacterium]